MVNPRKSLCIGLVLLLTTVFCAMLFFSVAVADERDEATRDVPDRSNDAVDRTQQTAGVAVNGPTILKVRDPQPVIEKYDPEANRPEEPVKLLENKMAPLLNYRAPYDKGPYTGPQNVPQRIPMVGGEDISTAKDIGAVPYSDNGSTTGHVDDYDETCPYNAPGSPDVVYSYVPTANGSIDISLCNSAYDTKLYVYEDDEYTLVACNDDACGLQSELACVPVSTGHTYYIVVDGYGGDHGYYEIDITPATPVATPCGVVCDPGATDEGETCGDDTNGGCNSIPEVYGSIDVGETVCGTMWADLALRDTDFLWHTFNGDTTATFSGVADLPFVLIIADMNSGCAGVAVINSITGAACDTVSVSADLLAGDYVFFVAPSEWDCYPCSENYKYNVWLEGVPWIPDIPDNNDCADAEAVGDVVDLVWSTADATASGFGTYIYSNDIFYCYTATCDGNATVSLCGTGWDTRVAVWDGCACVGGSPDWSDDDDCDYDVPPGGSGLASTVTFPVTMGNEYLIQVGGYSTNNGDGIMNISCAGGGSAQGDDCSDPIVIGSLPYSDYGQTTCGRTDDYNTTCLGYYDGGEDIIYELTVTTQTFVNVTMNPNGTTWNGVAIADECPPGASCLAYVTGYSGSPKELKCVDLAPGTYYIMVDTWPSPTCIPDFDLIVTDTVCVALENDDCADAIAISDTINLAWSTGTATPSGNGSYMYSSDIFYCYTATCTGMATASLCGTTWDTKIAVYDGCECGDLQDWTDDDGCPSGGPGSSLASEVTFPVTMGNEYLIQVGGYSTYSGDGVLSVWCTPPPPNDDCEDVTPVVLTSGVPQSFTGTSAGATSDCGLLSIAEVWESFTINDWSDVTVDFCGSPQYWGALYIVLVDGCPCNELIFGCGNDWTTCYDGNPTVRIENVPPGTYYYPIPDYPPNASGPYQVNILAVTTDPGYCCASSESCDEYIQRVELGDIDNSTGCDFYADYTATQSTLMWKGLGYDLTVTVGDAWSSDQGGCWIDWNQDWDFDDPGEVIPLVGSPGYGPYTATIVPPPGAVVGTTTMRLRVIWNAVPEACGYDGYGEVEDYAIVVDEFVCGDCNGDMVVDMIDIDCLEDYYFYYSANFPGMPYPLIAGDVNCDGDVNIADIVYVADYLFRGGPDPCCIP